MTKEKFIDIPLPDEKGIWRRIVQPQDETAKDESGNSNASGGRGRSRSIADDFATDARTQKDREDAEVEAKKKRDAEEKEKAERETARQREEHQRFITQMLLDQDTQRLLSETFQALDKDAREELQNTISAAFEKGDELGFQQIIDDLSQQRKRPGIRLQEQTVSRDGGQDTLRPKATQQPKRDHGPIDQPQPSLIDQLTQQVIDRRVNERESWVKARQMFHPGSTGHDRLTTLHTESATREVKEELARRLDKHFGRRPSHTVEERVQVTRDILETMVKEPVSRREPIRTYEEIHGRERPGHSRGFGR